MAETTSGGVARRKKKSESGENGHPRAIALADRGIATGADFASVFAALLSDTIAGRIDPRVSNAACNIGGKLLKVVELQFKYGRKIDGLEDRMLALTPLASKPQSESVQ